MALPKMTIAISSYQRRDRVLRLLDCLDEQLRSSAELRQDLEVVVVLDGSTDGSREAIERGTWSVPVRVVWQPNRGLAAARNVGLAGAAGGLVWFLDDDLIPTPGLVERHRRAHDAVPPSIVVGACRIPEGTEAPEPFLRWWDEFHESMAEHPVITRFDRFTAANASAPASLLADVGGFDESFVGYGMEDYELAVRLLESGTLIRYDGQAVAWHPNVPPRSVLVDRERSLGFNAARIVKLHPDTVAILFPRIHVSPPRRLIRRLRIRRARSLMSVSRASYVLCRLAPAGTKTSRRAENLARAAAQAAGVAEADPGGRLLSRVLGES